MPILTFDMNGGTTAPEPQTLEAGVAGTITSDAATRVISVIYDANGGIFYQGSSTRTDTTTLSSTAWATTPSGSAAYNAGDSITINDDTTLYAVWPTTLVTVNSLPIESNTSGNITERADYRLEHNKHWTTTQNGSTKVSEPWNITDATLNLNAVTIYAKWQYRISFQLTNGDTACDEGYSIQGPPYYVNGELPEYAGWTESNQINAGTHFSTIVLLYFINPYANPGDSEYNMYTTYLDPETGMPSYVPQAGDLVFCQLNNTLFYCDGDKWQNVPIPVTSTMNTVSPIVPRYTTTEQMYLQYVVPGTVLKNLVIALDYDAGGYTSADVALNGSSTTILFTPTPEDAIYGGTLNISTGEIVSTLNPDGTELDVPVTYHINPVEIETPESVTSVVISSTCGKVLGVQYYTSLESIGDIVPDVGDVNRQIHFWKTHGTNFTSPFTISNLLQDGYTAAGFAIDPLDARDHANLLPLNFTYSSDSPLLVYTSWSQQVFAIKFFSGYGDNEQIGETQYIPYGGSATAPHPHRPGYGLIGWSGSYQNVDADADLTAIWAQSLIWIRRDSEWKPYDPGE